MLGEMEKLQNKLTRQLQTRYLFYAVSQLRMQNREEIIIAFEHIKTNYVRNQCKPPKP
jgi:hypothetical protein